MKLIVLTTETRHHAFFVKEVGRFYPIHRVFVETQINRAPFETHHAFEDRQAQYEAEQFFAGREAVLADLAPTQRVETINSATAIQALSQIQPDLVVVFGTGRIRPPVIDLFPGRLVNLHGGDPERYRGLDSHLWSIYHGDFDSLVTTIHHVNPRLDDGRIIAQGSVPLAPGMEIHQLRRRNTQVCIELTLTALNMLERNGRLLSRPQRQKGRYYSFMPAGLKDICCQRFRRFTEAL